MLPWPKGEGAALLEEEACEEAEAEGVDTRARWQEEGPRNAKVFRMLKRVGLGVTVFLGVFLALLEWKHRSPVILTTDSKPDTMELMSTDNLNTRIHDQQNAENIVINHYYHGNDNDLDFQALGPRVLARAWFQIGLKGGISWGKMPITPKSCLYEALRHDENFGPAWMELGHLKGGYVKGKYYTGRDCYVHVILQHDSYAAAAWTELGLLDGGHVDSSDYAACDCLERALHFADLTKITFNECPETSQSAHRHAASALCKLGKKLAEKEVGAFATSVAKGLRGSRSLHDLDFRGINFGEEEVLGIIGALGRNQALGQLDFRGKTFSYELGSKIEKLSTLKTVTVLIDVLTTTTTTATRTSTHFVATTFTFMKGDMREASCDLNGGDLEHKQCNTADCCEHFCYEVEQCFGWTWKSPYCYLKGTLDHVTARVDAQCISGWRKMPAPSTHTFCNPDQAVETMKNMLERANNQYTADVIDFITRTIKGVQESKDEVPRVHDLPSEGQSSPGRTSDHGDAAPGGGEKPSDLGRALPITLVITGMALFGLGFYMHYRSPEDTAYIGERVMQFGADAWEWSKAKFQNLRAGTPRHRPHLAYHVDVGAAPNERRYGRNLRQQQQQQEMTPFMW